jgi:orotate phosphoribosyltransferase
MATSRTELQRVLRDRAVVSGEVVLSNGFTTNWYADLRQATLGGRTARWVGEVMLELTADWQYDAVGGLTLGADPVAIAMAMVAGLRGRQLDAFIVRKEPKRHGLQRRIEGPPVGGRGVLVVEDTSTTGASALTAAEAVRAAGVTVVGVAAVLDRGGSAGVSRAGLAFRAAYQPEDLGVISESSR